MNRLLQTYLSFRSKVRLHFFDALLKRARQRMERRRLRIKLPPPAADNPHWAHGGTDELKQMHKLRTR